MSHVIRELKGARDLLPLAAAHPARYPGFFESAARGNARARHDVLCLHDGGRIVLERGGAVVDESSREAAVDFLGTLDTRWRESRIDRADDELPPFRGGWLLYLGYELAAQLEPRLHLPLSPDVALPTAFALRCPAAIIVDHEQTRTVLVAETGREDLIERMQADLEAAPSWRERALHMDVIEEDAPHRFIDGVARVHEHLRAGDVFQVNLSRAWRARCAEAQRPADVYASLRRANPAPFAGLLQFGGAAVASSSPERLIEIRGDRVQTRPIAGTRARGENDDALIRELVAHPKERAEHVMLIDLERNDLGRVCTPGSVVVDEYMAVESYAHVHHIVSNVSGRLRDGVTPGDAIRAVFPGGTITGCPKVRCMQIISAIEGIGRGAYTGSFGYLNRDGDLDLNILIRTLTIEGEAIRFRAGAGIVVDSEAHRELEETRAKARGMLRALGATG